MESGIRKRNHGKGNGNEKVELIAKTPELLGHVTDW